MSDDKILSPQERLTLSRRAIVRYMTQDDEPDRSDAYGDRDVDGAHESHHAGGTWQTVKRAARVWWQHHPAQMAVNMARPALGKYAKDNPLQMVGIAAGVGAAAAVIRPWRLISVTGLLLAALKASDLPVLLLTLLSSSNDAPTTTKDMP